MYLYIDAAAALAVVINSLVLAIQEKLLSDWAAAKVTCKQYGVNQSLCYNILFDKNILEDKGQNYYIYIIHGFYSPFGKL